MFDSHAFSADAVVNCWNVQYFNYLHWSLKVERRKFVTHHIDYKGSVKTFTAGCKDVINLFLYHCFPPYLSFPLSFVCSTVCGVCHDLRSDVESYSWSSLCPQKPSKWTSGKCSSTSFPVYICLAFCVHSPHFLCPCNSIPVSKLTSCVNRSIDLTCVHIPHLLCP